LAHRHFGPSKLYYVLALAGLVGSFFALRLFWERRMEQVTADLTYGTVPGPVLVALPAPGQYAVYLEHQGRLDNQLFITGKELGALQCTVTSAAGEAVPVREPLWPVPYMSNARQGLQVLEFEVEKAGTYTLQGDYPSGTAGPQLLLAVGEGLLSLSGTLLGALGLALLPAFGGLILGGFIWRARKRARRRLYGRYA
jgi:hypothetical protein